MDKSNYTKNTYLNNPDHLVDEFEIKNIYLVLRIALVQLPYMAKQDGILFLFIICLKP